MLPGSSANFRSKLHQIALQLHVSLLLRPQVERDRRHLIYDRFGQPALRKVHRLDVALAAVASFHADVLEFLRGVDRELRVILFPASLTDDPPELPFRQAKRTHQRTLAAVSHRTQNTQTWFPFATRTGIRLQPTPAQTCS